jgi:hypothetical protein
LPAFLIHRRKPCARRCAKEHGILKKFSTGCRIAHTHAKHDMVFALIENFFKTPCPWLLQKQRLLKFPCQARKTVRRDVFKK